MFDGWGIEGSCIYVVFICVFVSMGLNELEISSTPGVVAIYSDLNWTKSKVARDEHVRFGFSMTSFGLDPDRHRILLSIEV